MKTSTASLQRVRASMILKKTFAFVVVYAMYFQMAMPAHSAPLPSSTIERDLSHNPLFERSISNSDVQYTTADYLERSAPSATTLASFYKTIFADHKLRLGEPKYIPIGVGDITTIIPIYDKPKYVGTPLVQSRYIRSQIHGLLGRNLIDGSEPDYISEAQQINTLYQNALSFMQNENTDVILGEPLGLDQEASGLAQNIVWPEYRTIHGEKILVPVVYLTQHTVSTRRVKDHNVFIGAGASFNNLNIEGVGVRFGRDAFLNVAGNLSNYQGSISGSEDLKITASGKLDNISGIIEAEGNLVIGAHSIESRTIVHRYDFGANQGGRFGEIAAFNAENGDVVLRADSNILIEGGIVSAACVDDNSERECGNIYFGAGGDIYVGPAQYVEQTVEEGRGWKRERSLTQVFGSSLTADQTISLVASGNIKIDASDLIADRGHIELLAGLGIEIIDTPAQSQYSNFRKSGSTTVNESAYRTVAMRSLLDSGKDIRIHSGFGSITLRAADINSIEGTSVTASNGAVNMLMTVENDQYSYSSVSEKLFTTTTISRGHNIETAVPNTIVGGFQAEALYGLNVEYEGAEGKYLHDQIDAFREIEGLEWIARIYDDPQVEIDWTEIDTAYQTWNDKSTSLSAAAIALITIVVAVATAGAGAAMIGTAGTTSAGAVSVGGAMMNAGFTAMVSTATIATANAAVNGGDIEDIAKAGFEAVHSKEGLKSVATAMVTAGAIAQIDAKFFQATDAEVNNALKLAESEAGRALSATEVQAVVQRAQKLTLVEQATQALTHSVANAGIQTLADGGNISDFQDAFIGSLGQNAVNVLGRNVATAIGDAAHASPPKINLASQYIAHAALGCVTGSLTSLLSESDLENGCLSGSGGALIGEFIGQANREQLERELAEDVQGFAARYLDPNTDYSVRDFDKAIRNYLARGVDIARLSAAFAAFAAGGDINVASGAAGTSSQFNASSHPQELAALGSARARLQLNPGWALFNDAFGTSWDRIARVLSGEDLDLSSDEFFQRELDRNPTLSNALSAIGENTLNNAGANIEVYLAMVLGTLGASFGELNDSTGTGDQQPVQLEDFEVIALQGQVTTVLREIAWREKGRVDALEADNDYGVERAQIEIEANLVRLTNLVAELSPYSDLIDQLNDSSYINLPPNHELDTQTALPIPDVSPITAMIFESWESVAAEYDIETGVPGFNATGGLAPGNYITPVIDRRPTESIMISEDSAPQTFPNLQGDNLAEELDLMERLGYVSAEVGSEDFDNYINGPVKWILTTEEKILVIPKNDGADEVSHAALANGQEVVAAGEASIVNIGGGMTIGLQITRHSGHYIPSAQSLDIALERFREYGIVFNEVNYQVPER